MPLISFELRPDSLRCGEKISLQKRHGNLSFGSPPTRFEARIIIQYQRLRGSAS
jgi:hypothetical protein